MRALIDGDVLVYRCGFAAQKTIHTVAIKGEEEYGHIATFSTKGEAIEWAEETVGKDAYVLGTIVEAEPLEFALSTVRAVLQSILDYTKADEYTVFLTGDGNFREELATIRKYKGNRDKLTRPAHYADIRKYMLGVWNAQLVEGQEADDAMAQCQWADYSHTLAAVEAGEDKDPQHCAETVICTIDKDLDMVPGWHYNFVKDEMYWVDEESATYNFYKQLLTGDTVDNIQGVPGIGSAKADKALLELKTEQELFCKVGFLYALAYDDPEAALEENAQLLWMRREEGKGWQAPAPESAS